MKKLLLFLLFIPLLTFSQESVIDDLGLEKAEFCCQKKLNPVGTVARVISTDGSINYISDPYDCDNIVQYVYDGNPFNDNEKSLTFFLQELSPEKYPYPKPYIKISKSDIKPEKIEIHSVFKVDGWDSSKTVECTYEFIFDNDKSTYFKLDAISKKKITTLESELFLKFKKYNKVIIRQTYPEYYVGGSNTRDYSFTLNGMTAAINKYLNVEAPTMKNKSSYEVVNGLANANPFNLDKYIDQFILDAKRNHNINLSYVNNNEKLIFFKELNEQTIAVAFEKNNNSSVVVTVDPENWNAASQAKRWYIIYHELGHDILNLDHGEGGKMMEEFASGQYNWSRLERDKNTMFEFYKNNIQ